MERKHVAQALKASTGRIEHTDAILRHKPKLSALHIEEGVDDGEEDVAQASVHMVAECGRNKHVNTRFRAHRQSALDIRREGAHTVQSLQLAELRFA